MDVALPGIAVAHHADQWLSSKHVLQTDLKMKSRQTQDLYYLLICRLILICGFKCIV